MNDPIRHLESFYEVCDHAHPSRMLADPALQPRIAARRILGWALSALGPLSVGGAIALLVMTAGSRMGVAPPFGVARPMLEYRMKQAELSSQDLSVAPRPQQEKAEARAWRA